MEIMIRTEDEITADRLTIEVNGVSVADRVVTSLNSRRLWDEDSLYTREMVIYLQASEAELVSAPLRRQIDQLTSELARERSAREAADVVREEMAIRIKELEDDRRLSDRAYTAADEARLKRTGAHRRIEQLTSELARERERADENRARAERAVGRTEALTQQLETAHRKLRNVSRAVSADRPHIENAMRTMWLAWTESEAVALMTTIRDIRDMTCPWADPPGPGTSQA